MDLALSLQHQPLNACAGLAHAFLFKDPAVDVDAPKDTAVTRLTASFRHRVEALGFHWDQLQTAEQTHGDGLAVVNEPLGGLNALPVVDGLLTNRPGVLLGIMVADCCAVSIVDPKQHAVALLHSGKKGTEANITAKAIKQLAARFGSKPADLIVQLSPCIRPPHHEVDIASLIKAQAADAGVPKSHIHDEGLCTFSDADRFYSYRRERGFTGRMLALLGHPRLGSS